MTLDIIFIKIILNSSTFIELTVFSGGVWAVSKLKIIRLN